MEINLNMYQTLAAAVAVFFLGGFLKTKIKLLRKYCIPAPVIGGTIFSILNCILYTEGLWTYTQDTVMQNWCMMLFFTSIGYMASVHLIRKGGPSGHQNGPAGRHPHYHAEPHRHFPFPLFR